ncbi:hypothetical protein [Persicobacter psychrovividus]|uniref:ATP F0F1 synthase synthase n=1 Tax=Persicobacter psychrovividus TaxID=387638 RepID=A0ABN6LBD2_9BACT|nr:hypothetical protein PEPS_28080 [Persicobacter psychrovividus]
MNYLLAEIKSRKKENKTFKVFGESNEIYPLPTDLNNPKTYDSDYKLEDDEWFHIPNFKSSDYSITLLNSPFDSVNYTSINQSKLKKIKYLIAHQSYDGGKSYFFFQKINTSHLLNKSWIKISDTPKLDKTPILVINDMADAIYSVEDDILYFKKLNSLSTIFIGISELYRVATETETSTFLANDFINLANNFSSTKVGTPNRKRIALAVDTLSKFDNSQKGQIFSYIKDYCDDDLPYDDATKKFSVKDEEGLKHLLWGIEQRYYTTKVGFEKRVANSVSPL